MDTGDVALWFSALLNAMLAVGLAVRYRFRVRTKAMTERRAKAIYSRFCIAVGIFSGIVVFFGIMVLFNIPTGHGEILIAAPILNLLLSAISIGVGRVVIGWVPMNSLRPPS